MACDTIILRSEFTTNIDVREIRPANHPARVVEIGKGLDGTIISLATPAGNTMATGSCKVFSAEAAGANGHILTSSVVRDSGTPYAVTTIQIED